MTTLEQEIRAIRALDRIAKKHATKVERILSTLSAESRSRVLRFDASKDGRLPSQTEMRLSLEDDPIGE